MVRLRAWQWVVLVSPIALVVTIILVAAGWQLHTWGLSWIWAAVTLLLLGWRWLLVRWTQPVVQQMEAVVAQVSKDLEAAEAAIALPDASNQPDLELTLQAIFAEAQNDLPIWEDWTTFWLRCREVVVAIAHLYHPEVKYPLLNIYIPQAYGLIRGTVDDLDQWMQKLSPVLNQVTVGQAYQAYEVYQKLEPSARKLWQVWNWAQWILNPAAAVARQASRKSGDRATQQLLVNLGQMLRETALRNLANQAIALYGGSDSGSFGDSTSSSNPTISPLPPTFKSALPKAQTQTLRDILAQVEPVEAVEQKPVNLLVVGRTGAGKSSLINTLFQADLATVDMLPSTDQMQHYQWQTATGETLTLWDTPGYEQVNRPEFRAQVLDYAAQADVLLLVTPALDPALQMDVDFLKDVHDSVAQLPAIAVVTQVDRLRPFREWEPPYDWERGDRPKELAIREATRYRVEQLGPWCDRVLPVV
ncbi:MAG TPA: GTPase, partial [Chroococcidiopsis sp.]